MKLKSVSMSDKEILDSFNTIYLKGKGFDLDPTYSVGNMYKKYGAPEPTFKCDLEPKHWYVEKADCQNLRTFADGCLKSIVFDPPFIFTPYANGGDYKMCKRFSYFKSFDSMISMYRGSLKEFKRILKNKGYVIFKCQDMSNGHFYDTHCKVIELAKELGFKLMDIAILHRKNPPFFREVKKQTCLRKAHCYWIVLRKEN